MRASRDYIDSPTNIQGLVHHIHDEPRWITMKVWKNKPNKGEEVAWASKILLQRGGRESVCLVSAKDV